MEQTRCDYYVTFICLAECGLICQDLHQFSYIPRIFREMNSYFHVDIIQQDYLCTEKKFKFKLFANLREFICPLIHRKIKIFSYITIETDILMRIANDTEIFCCIDFFFVIQSI